MRILLALILVSLAASTPAAEQSIDPVRVSPDMYSVLLENEHVRVVEYRIEPGQKEPWHTHPAKAMYVIEGGRLKITLPDGTSFVADEEAGKAHWMGAVGRHYGENVGDTTVRIVMVEVKAAEGTAPPEDADSLSKFAQPDE
ncbi:MAG: cupin domain-containing protein [Xanthomonadales bacterium]|nr:cupin domain-containing protein [Xanthomonadales bacterium]